MSLRNAKESSTKCPKGKNCDCTPHLNSLGQNEYLAAKLTLLLASRTKCRETKEALHEIVLRSSSSRSLLCKQLKIIAEGSSFELTLPNEPL